MPSAPAFPTPRLPVISLPVAAGTGLLADIPLGRVALPDDIATIATLYALDAPENMTGTVIDATGVSYVR